MKKASVQEFAFALAFPYIVLHPPVNAVSD